MGILNISYITRRAIFSFQIDIPPKNFMPSEKYENETSGHLNFLNLVFLDFIETKQNNIDEKISVNTSCEL